MAVPISVIADIDILNEETTFRTLYEKLCGNWEDISNHWRSIKNSIEALNPPINADQVKSLLLTELGNVSGVGKFPKETERNIKNIFKSLSPWDNVKHVGRNALRGAETIKHFDQLVEKCSAKGLWIVKVGELEGFCRMRDARHELTYSNKMYETSQFAQ